MILQMTGAQLEIFKSGLAATQKYPGPIFHYAVIKNKNRVERALASLKESLFDTPKYTEFTKQRIALCEEYAEKDSIGKPLVKDETYVGLLTNKVFNKKYVELQKIHKEAIDEKVKQEKEYRVFFYTKKQDFEVHQVDVKKVPEELLGKDMENIQWMIDGLVEEPKK